MTANENSAEAAPSPPAFLIVDTESVPDGKLLAAVKYPHDNLSPEAAVARAQAEARDASFSGSDFLPVTFHFPIAACVLRVGADYGLQNLTCLDAPLFRPRKIVESFWDGCCRHRAKQRERLKLVTFNGRGFDLPLLEVSAFRYGVKVGDLFANTRKRYEGWHLDLMDWLSNYNAFRLVGGLNLLSKLLGKPGKMEIKGDQIYQMYQAGQQQAINDYCMYDTLDTYFVFLRTRVLCGDINLEQEHIAVLRAKEWVQAKAAEMPALKQYLDNWGDWSPWP